MFKILLISLAVSATFLGAQPTVSHAHPMKLPLVFEPNQGQAIPQAQWIANGPGYQLAFTKHSMMIHLNKSASKANHDLQIELPGSRLWNHVTGLEPTGGVSNYPGRRGANSSLQNVPHYARLRIADVYDGVDLEFYGNAGEPEYDFVVHPGADPNQIQLAFTGERKMHIDHASGDLVLETVDGGNLRELRPIIYQQTDKRLPLDAGYKMISANRVGFTLGKYDKQRTLIIDPVVKLSTFLNHASSNAIAVDKEGTSYITGEADSLFTVTDYSKFKHCIPSGFLGFCYNGDVYVAKITQTGLILFSTFLEPGAGTGIAVDSTGVYVTAAVFDAEENNSQAGGGTNLGVMKLSLTGSLLYEQVLAGTGYDQGSAIAVDSQHDAWVTGYIQFPKGSTTQSDIRLIKLGPTGTVLNNQTIGGSSDDRGNGIAVDSNDNPWITGQTCSGDFPATPGLNNLKAQCGVFVVSLTNQSPHASIKFASVFGGSGVDAGIAITVNANHEAYVTGLTQCLAFPVQDPAYQTFVNGPGSQAFVTKLDSAGHFIYSTLLGSDGDTAGSGIALNAMGEVYIAGTTTATNFPGIGAMSLGTYSGASGFLSKFSPDLSKLLYSRQVGDVSAGLAAIERVLALTPAELYVTGSQYLNGDYHAFVDRIIDDTALAHLRNFWISDRFINIESGTPSAGQIGADWWSAEWIFEPAPTSGPNAFLIRNRWQSNQYLTLGTGTVPTTTTDATSLFARWVFQPVNGTNVYRLCNFYRDNACLNIETGTLQASPVDPGWWSAYWIIEPSYY